MKLTINIPYNKRVYLSKCLFSDATVDIIDLDEGGIYRYFLYESGFEVDGENKIISEN